MIAVTQCSELSHAADFSRIARRNNSLTSGSRLLVFGFLFVVSTGIAAAFAAAGAWPVLPFAGLEMAVLFAAFRAVERRAADFERIAVNGDKVKVEIREEGRMRGHELNRHWAQVVVGDGGARLALRSHGREVAIGRHLNDHQRLALARELGRALHGGAWNAARAART